MNKNEIDQNKMGTMPVGKLILTMSVPAIFSMLISALYNIVDSIFVGILGESALAAVTLIFPIQMLIISVGVGTGIGLNSVISRRLGEKNEDEANKAANHGIFLAFINWIIFAVFGLFFTKFFVESFTDSLSIAPDAILYCKIVCIGSLFIFIHLNVEKMLQATGNMLFPMFCGLLGAITNIVLDPILIFGLLGAPKMGVAGAAIATVIGQLFSMILGLVFLFVLKHDIHVSIKKFKLNSKTIKDIYFVGFPSIIMQAIGSVMLVGFNAILISFSDAAVAVLGAYFRLQSFIFMPVFGLTQGAMPIFGYNFGAKNKERLLKAFKIAMFIALGIMGLGTIIFQVMPVQLLKIFSATPQMVSIGVPALRIISSCFLFAAFGIIASTLFQALGHGMLSLFVSVLRQLLIILPIAFLLAKLAGLSYVWWAFPLAELFSMLASIYFLKHLYKKEIYNLSV